MATISGSIRTETGGPALGATVRAFDKDLRHEQILGEVVITETTGHYEIAYTADKYRRAEKKTADLIVRAWDENDNLRAESEIRFNASDNERIDLTFGPVPVRETPRLSELEQLQKSVAPVQEGVAYRDFTDAGGRFGRGSRRLTIVPGVSRFVSRNSGKVAVATGAGGMAARFTVPYYAEGAALLESAGGLHTLRAYAMTPVGQASVRFGAVGLSLLAGVVIGRVSAEAAGEEEFYAGGDSTHLRQRCRVRPAHGRRQPAADRCRLGGGGERRDLLGRQVRAGDQVLNALGMTGVHER